MKIDTENQVAMRNWQRIAEAAADIKVAYNLANSIKGPWEHPPFPCTTIGLALINDNGQQLSRLHVQETPEQVVEIIEGRTDPTLPVLR